MKKVIFVFVVVLFGVMVFAQSSDVKEKIKDVAEERGEVIEDEDIKEINFTDLPGELDIEEIGDTSVSIYEVNFSDRPFFVITAGGMFEAEPEVAVGETRTLFHFGVAGEVESPEFLNMASGVSSSMDRGYVMMRGGSVTGISSSLDVVDFVNGEIVEIVIYRNGEEIGFRNVLGAGDLGVEIDYDLISKGVVNFEAGDVLSVYVLFGTGVVVEDVSVALEVTN